MPFASAWPARTRPIFHAVRRFRAPLLPAVIASVLLLAYAAQTSLGRWQVDEFTYFTAHRALGWTAYFTRFYVSPRPFSELLIYAYGAAVLRFDWPFIAPSLLILWSGIVLVMGWAAWSALQRSPGRLAAAISLGIAPMVFVMVTNPITETFYWPIAAVAYLPTIAGATALLFRLDAAPTLRTRLWCGGALLLSAMSHEIGAALAIGFAAAAALCTAIDLAGRPIKSADIKGALWWLIPGVAGLIVMVALVVFRSDIVDLGSDTKPYTGRLLASAAAALRQMLLDAVSTGNSPPGWTGLGTAMAEKLTFAIGFALVWLRFGRVQPGRWHLALAFGLGVAIYFSLLAAYYHYGDLCCERQATTRHWLIDLGYILGAAAILARWPALYAPSPRNGVAGWLGSVVLAASLWPVLLQIDGIKTDFYFIGLARQARTRTWQSGLVPGNGAMQFYMPPESKDMLIHGTSETVATYDLTQKAPELVAAIGRFFGKSTVSTCQAWQSEHSILINGVFIPACPPHPGPPDLIFDTPSSRS